jgi:exonuclease SbcC
VKLKRLKINQLPGINVPFEIVPEEANIHVVIGPNGIGKSSLCRAVEALYWSDLGPTQRTSVNGEFELDGEAWWAERESARVRWQHAGVDSAPPNLPPSYNHNCFFLRLRDLIDPSPEGTRNVASEIRRQMSGGFDLGKIVSDLFDGVGGQHGRRERREFNTALQQIQKAEGDHIGLQRRADELDNLKSKLAEADSSGRRLTYVNRALGLAGRREELAGVVEELSILPTSLANLTGKEPNQIETYQSRAEELNGRIRKLEGELAAACEDQLDSGLEAPLAPAQLTAWRENAEQLSRLEVELDASRNEHSGCNTELAAALASVGGSNVNEVKLDLAGHSQLFEFLRAAQSHKDRVNAIEERLRLLAGIERHEESQRAFEQIRGAVEALRSWLHAPEPESVSGEKKARRFWMIAAAVLVVVGVGLAVIADPTFAVIAAIGAGIMLPVFLRRHRQAGSDQRQVSQESFEKFDVDELPTWEKPSVESRLRDLETEVAILDAQIVRARDRDVDQQSLKNKLEGLADAQSGLDARRQQLQDSLKLDAIPPDAELVDFARALDQLRSAQSKDQNAEGKVRELEKRHTELLTDLACALEHHGEARSTDATTAMASLNQLASRDSKLQKAMSDKGAAAGQLQQATSDRNLAVQSLAKIYADAGLEIDDLHGLTALLDSLPRYMELARARMRLQSQIELDQTELSNASESDLGELDKLALERLHDENSRAAEKITELRDEIASINAQVDAAQRGHSIQDLIAVQDEALAKLHDRRSEALFAKAGRLLMDGIEREYEQTQMPRVLERARGLFSAFTHHHYELGLGSGAEATQLIAIDLQSGEGLGLEELSDGTRAQLLLAARIAFAEEVEQGRTLPLFLDEALDQSDPARYEAIVRSLGRVAEDQGRQIFYLTSDPADVGRIQHALDKEQCDLPAVIDLGLVRRNAASISGPSVLHVEPRPPVPSPNGLSADEYGAALGVPALDPSLGYVQQHFFHVLWDDLDLLHEFLTHGIERVGQWRTVLETPLADKLGAQSKSPEEIALRSDLLEIFCEFWNQGRGRPVDREALEDSDALSDRFLDNVVEIANELRGNPENLLDALRAREDERLRGFRSNSLEKLESYMRENGYLDDQPVLAEAELRLRALSSPAANQLPAGTADECLNRWWTLAERANEPDAQ